MLEKDNCLKITSVYSRANVASFLFFFFFLPVLAWTSGKEE